MLTIDQLENYTTRAKDALPAIKRAEVSVVKDDLEKFMQAHKKDENVLMLSLVPEHGVSGTEDAAMMGNTCGFFFLVKTDYSSLKQPDYLQLFKDTQAVAKAFIELLLADKAENYGCGMFAWLEEGSITASPIKALNGCNGYYVEVAMKTRL